MPQILEKAAHLTRIWATKQTHQNHDDINYENFVFVQ